MNAVRIVLVAASYKCTVEAQGIVVFPPQTTPGHHQEFRPVSRAAHVIIAAVSVGTIIMDAVKWSSKFNQICLTLYTGHVITEISY